MALSLADCIDKIESNYEYMLAYAAQGRDFEAIGGDGPPIRGALVELKTAIEQIGDRFEEQTKAAGAARAAFLAFCSVLKSDGERAVKAIDLVLSVRNISSQLIDNLNASSHVRALLTDMFLLDEATKTLAAPAQH